MRTARHPEDLPTRRARAFSCASASRRRAVGAGRPSLYGPWLTLATDSRHPEPPHRAGKRPGHCCCYRARAHRARHHAMRLHCDAFRSSAHRCSDANRPSPPLSLTSLRAGTRAGGEGVRSSVRACRGGRQAGGRARRTRTSEERSRSCRPASVSSAFSTVASAARTDNLKVWLKSTTEGGGIIFPIVQRPCTPHGIQRS